jgi:hypothetical protein
MSKQNGDDDEESDEDSYGDLEGKEDMDVDSDEGSSGEESEET